MAAQNYDITDDVVSYLGIKSADYTNSSFNYDFAFNGVPFLSCTSDQYPYRRQLIDIRKQQFDSSADPGEQSLSGWWIRSQSSFTGGAGINFLEPTSDERVMRSFNDSVGVNVWNDGEVTLLDAMDYVPLPNFTTKFMCVCFDSSGNERIITAGSTSIQIRNTSGVQVGSSITTGFTGNIIGLVSIGTGFVFWTSTTSGGVYLVSGNLSFATTIYAPSNPGTNAHTINRVWYVKNRLIVAQTDSSGKKNLTEASLASGYNGQLSSTHICEINQSTWVWSDVIDIPSGFLISGYSGGYSTVSRVGLNSNGSILTLTYPTTVAEMPAGEYILCMKSYLGSYVGIGTNKGFRVGTVDSNGLLSYGPLIVSPYGNVTAITAFDRFLWFAALEYSSIYSGVTTYRVDLSDPDGSGFFPYAADVSIGGDIDVYNMSTLSNGKIVATLSSSGALYIQSDNSVSSGTLVTGKIRFSTLEPKVFKRIRVRGNVSMNISSYDDNGTLTDVVDVNSSNVGSEFAVKPGDPMDYMSLRFTITGGSLRGYQLKALPAVTKGENIQVNLLCFDYETDKNGSRLGIENSSRTRFMLLRDSVNNGDIVTMQDLNTGEKLSVVIDGLDFAQTAPPRPGMSGFGGILTITARTIV